MLQAVTVTDHHRVTALAIDIFKDSDDRRWRESQQLHELSKVVSICAELNDVRSGTPIMIGKSVIAVHDQAVRDEMPVAAERLMRMFLRSVVMLGIQLVQPIHDPVTLNDVWMGWR